MKTQLTARISVVTREIEEIEEMLADTYHCCPDEHDQDMLNDDLEDYLDEKEELEVELKHWN